MSLYRVIASIEFDSEDLRTFAENLGLDELDPDSAVQGELDNLGIGSAYIEQIFRNGKPTIHRLLGDGIEVIINDHALDGTEEEEDDFLDYDDEEEDD